MAIASSCRRWKPRLPEQPELRRFDAEFFGLPPSEAAILDPQHRLLLETAWHALEHAGCAPEKFPGRVGVFVGAAASAYLQQHLLPQRDRLASVSDLQLRLACDPEFLATRIAYKLNLKGPAVSVSTAYSTSLVAVHLACRSLQDGDCELAHDPSRMVEASRPLAELGIDSLGSIQLSERLVQDLRVGLPVRALLGGSIEVLANALSDRLTCQPWASVPGCTRSSAR